MSIVEQPPFEQPPIDSRISLPELIAGAHPVAIDTIVGAYTKMYQAGFAIGTRLTDAWLQDQQAERDKLATSNAALSASNAELSDRLDLEPKTQLLNQVAFNRLAQEIINDPKTVEGRRHQGFALLFLDLDDFKKVNTALGELEADRLCLLPAAQIIKNYTRRASDLAGAAELAYTEQPEQPTAEDHTSQASRFGGEEFTMLLAGVDKAGALSIAERLQADINTLRYTEGNEERQLGVSIGISVFPAGADYETVLQLANDAEGHAKTFPGKNQIVVAAGYNQITLDALRN